MFQTGGRITGQDDGRGWVRVRSTLEPCNLRFRTAWSSTQCNNGSCIEGLFAHRYGSIGQSAARLARAFKMRVVGLRRAELSQKEKEEGLVVRAGWNVVGRI